MYFLESTIELLRSWRAFLKLLTQRAVYYLSSKLQRRALKIGLSTVPA